MDKYLCVIRQDKEDWYLLCVRDTLFCVASGSLDSIKKSIRNIKRTHRTAFNLSEALSNLSEPARCSPATYAARKSVYDHQDGEYDYILEDILKEEYDRAREKRKPKKPLLVKAKKVVVQEPVRKVTLPTAKKKTPEKGSVKKALMKPIKSKKALMMV